ncbi:peptidase S8/S53 domain-containing protein [Mycena epipterygia]|nr:peptidase S8/S53 domain-containing protein [Mycena epipterygia]
MPLVVAVVKTRLMLRKGNVEGDGHGTEVAGAAAANNFGVVSGATIVPIKLYDSPQRYDFSSLVCGVEAAVDNFRIKKLKNSQAAAVINISIDSPNETALQSSIAEALDENMHVVIAAGNDKKDRCSGDFVTARTNTNVQAAITVGATDIHDQLAVLPPVRRPWFKLWPSVLGDLGRYFYRYILTVCRDIYAGGYNILTLGPKQLPKIFFGTSLAAPQVAGIIAAIISTSHEGFTISPTKMKTMMLKAGAADKIQRLSADSNNLSAQLPDSLKQAISATNPAPPTSSAAPNDADSDDDWGSSRDDVGGGEFHNFQ